MKTQVKKEERWHQKLLFLWRERSNTWKESDYRVYEYKEAIKYLESFQYNSKQNTMKIERFWELPTNQVVQLHRAASSLSDWAGVEVAMVDVPPYILCPRLPWGRQFWNGQK